MHAAHTANTGRTDGPTLYLLFAGFHGQDRRGTGDLVATLSSPTEAREAFRQVRLQLPDRDGWAELSAVSAGGTVTYLGWFGRDRRVGANPAAWTVAEGKGLVRETRSVARARAWRARAGRTTAPGTRLPRRRSLRRQGEAG